jgi:hypothetical protein
MEDVVLFRERDVRVEMKQAIPASPDTKDFVPLISGSVYGSLDR